MDKQQQATSVRPVKHYDHPLKTKCPHRGPAISSVECSLCGQRGKLIPIYSCAVHGSCTHNKHKSSSQSEHTCIGCPDGPYC